MKQIDKFLKKDKDDYELEEKKSEVIKQKEIKKIIKTEHEFEN